MFGSISTNEHNMIQPNRPDHQTEDTMPFGTETEAFTVSSAVCAEAS